MVSKAKLIKYTKKGLCTLWWIVLILLAALIVNILGAKFTGKVPKLFGYSIMLIVSGSMEPEIPKDSYILIKETDPLEIKKDDVICFYSDDPTIYGYPNTHRVVAEPTYTDEGVRFTTKGDAAYGDDTVPARGESLIGVYVTRLDWLTDFSSILSENTMFIVIIALQVAFSAVFIISLFVGKKGKVSVTDGDGSESASDGSDKTE